MVRVRVRQLDMFISRTKMSWPNLQVSKLGNILAMFREGFGQGLATFRGKGAGCKAML